MQVSTLILKPTKHCNAGCTYCAAPPEVNGAAKWDVDLFRRRFDALLPSLTPSATVLWHGGEPMLMGPDFYVAAWEHVRSQLPRASFAIQTNLLSYSTRRWAHVFRDVMGGRVSTSYDPDERNRLLKGSSEAYTRVFMERLDWALDDGFRPMVIGTYTDETVPFSTRMYERVLGWGDRAPSLRFNYRFPAGRDAGTEPAITPQAYGRMLIDLYDRWVVDAPRFAITPLDLMVKRAAGLMEGLCPWTKDCAGRFLAMEPNGDVYNCATVADLQDPGLRYGNVDVDDVRQLLSSPAARAMRRRRYDVPEDCKSCRHFTSCEGGCMADSALYGRGLYGKFYYCESWKMVFDRVKRSIATGEADRVMARIGVDPVRARAVLGGRAAVPEAVA